MRKFIINVNGNQYEVEVEEIGGASQTIAPQAPITPVVSAAPAQAPEKAAAPKPAAPAPVVVLPHRAGAVKNQCSNAWDNT